MDHFVRVDAGVLPFSDGVFSFATGCMSLMYVSHHHVLRGSFRVLQLGGFLRVSVMHRCLVPVGAGAPWANCATAVARTCVTDSRVAPLFLHLRGRTP